MLILLFALLGFGAESDPCPWSGPIEVDSEHTGLSIDGMELVLREPQWQELREPMMACGMPNLWSALVLWHYSGRNVQNWRQVVSAADHWNAEVEPMQSEAITACPIQHPAEVVIKHNILEINDVRYFLDDGGWRDLRDPMLSCQMNQAWSALLTWQGGGRMLASAGPLRAAFAQWNEEADPAKIAKLQERREAALDRAGDKHLEIVARRYLDTGEMVVELAPSDDSGLDVDALPEFASAMNALDHLTARGWELAESHGFARDDHDVTVYVLRRRPRR